MTDRKILIENIIECYLTQNNLTETEANEIVSLRNDLKAINYMRCSTQLKSVDVISFEEWKKRFLVKTETKNIYELRGNFLSSQTLYLAYSKDVELFNSLIV